MRHPSAPTNSSRRSHTSKHPKAVTSIPPVTSTMLNSYCGQHLRLGQAARTQTVVRIAAAYTLEYPTASPQTSVRQPTTAITPSQLADEVQHYAAAAIAAGCRPGNTDAFLSSRLCELFSQPHRLRRLQPRQLASLLLSLAALGANPGEDSLCDIDAACYGHPGPFDPASTAAVLQGMAALHTASPSPSPSPPQPATATSHPSKVPHIPEPPALYPASSISQAPAPTSSYTLATGSGVTVGVSYADAPCSQGPPQQATWRTASLRNHHSWRQSPAVKKPAGAPPALTRSLATSLSATNAPSQGTVADPVAAAVPHFSPAYTPAAIPTAPAPYRFPHAVLLRLLQGGICSYSYEQLSVLLQAFRSLRISLDDEVVLLVGRRMADLLANMEPEQQLAALAGVLGGGGWMQCQQGVREARVS